MINNSRGLTLIETIIALALVVVLVTAFAGAMTTGLKSEDQMKNRKEAVNFASEIIENLKTRTGNSNKLSKIINNPDNEYSKDNNIIQINDIDGKFANKSDFYTAEIEYEKEDKINSLYKLTVKIKWTANNENYSEKIVTLMAVDLNEES